jgi:TonB family protein
MIPSYLVPLANHLWQSTLFAAVAALLILMLRKDRAAARYAVWLAASVKFLIPFSLLLSFGSSFALNSGVTITDPSLFAIVDDFSRPFAVATSPAPDQPGLTKVKELMPFALIGVWLLGLATVFLLWTRDWLHVRRALRTARPIQLSVPIKVMSSPARLEPGVVGIFRQVLLLPEGIASHLSPPQMDAIVTHELCHIRRRDNLTAAIHMMVEALFWFHPLVWWIESRLLEERERACDEAVLQTGEREAAVYAEAILNVCKFCADVRIAFVSGVSGANLKKRIEAIMAQEANRNLTAGKKLLLAIAGILAVAGPIVGGLIGAGSTMAQPVVGRVQIAPTNTATAIAQFEGVLKRDPNNSEAVAGLAGAYMAAGDFRKAREYYLRFAQLNPLQATAFYGVGTVAWVIVADRKMPLPDDEKFHLIEEGLRHLDIALALDRDYADAMAYKNLLLREKAKLASNQAEKNALIAEADSWFNRALETKRLQSVSTAPSGTVLRVMPPPPPPPGGRGQLESVVAGTAVPQSAETAEANLIARVNPAYPPLAKQARVQGSVVLDILIDGNGAVRDVHVRAGHPLLQQAAVDAVRQWRYKPLLVDGVATDVATTVTVTFAL